MSRQGHTVRAEARHVRPVGSTARRDHTIASRWLAGDAARLLAFDFGMSIPAVWAAIRANVRLKP